jgi:hypothetical protein
MVKSSTDGSGTKGISVVGGEGGNGGEDSVNDGIVGWGR